MEMSSPIVKRPPVKAIRRFIVDGGVPAMVPPGRGVGIRWDLDPTWCRRNTQVTILYGFSITDEFKVAGVVTNEDQFQDIYRQLDNQVSNLWYALKIKDLDNGEYWFSDPAPVGTSMRKREWLAAKEIVRREYFRLVKRRAGTRGWLLRRRITGQPCTACTSPETGQVVMANCPYCYGTSFVGGYYKPQEHWVEIPPDLVLRRLDPTEGPIAGFQSTFRCLAYPTLHPNDYWISAKSGTVYRIKENISTVARYEEEPLVLQGDWYIEDSKNIIYTYPIPAT
jgi:hypothetical protein